MQPCERTRIGPQTFWLAADNGSSATRNPQDATGNTRETGVSTSARATRLTELTSERPHRLWGLRLFTGEQRRHASTPE